MSKLRRTGAFVPHAAQPSAENAPNGLHAPVARHLLLRRPSEAAQMETRMDENAGNAVRTLRQKLRMTQEEFAHEIAVTVSTVNRWENSHAEPSKLAWKAINELARRRGVNDDVLARSAAAVNGN